MTNRQLEIIAGQNQLVEGVVLDADGTGADFEVDKTITDTPTQFITLSDPTISRFLLEEVVYYMAAANAVTFQLYLLQDALADDMLSLRQVCFDSGAAQARNTIYPRLDVEDKLPIVVDLVTPGIMYYLQDWSGAMGNCPGWLRVRGRKLF